MRIVYFGSRRGKSFEQFLSSWNAYVLEHFGENVKITVHDQEKIKSLEQEIDGLKKKLDDAECLIRYVSSRNCPSDINERIDSYLKENEE